MRDMQLKRMISDYPDCIRERNRFRALLLDYYPDNRLMVNLHMILYDEGMYQQMQLGKLNNAQENERWIMRIEKDYGIKRDLIQNAIHEWNYAYGIVVEDACDVMKSESIVETHDLDRTVDYSRYYEYIETEEGLVITKYLGFDEQTMIVPESVDGKRVYSIGKSVFMGNVSLVSVIIEEGVECIGKACFGKCKNLKNVKLPSTLTNIETWAFSYTAIEEINIPPMIEYLHDCFYSCSHLQKIRFDSCKKLISLNDFNYCDGLVEVQLPETLITVGGFWECKRLQKVVIPCVLEWMPPQTFKNCVNLQEMYIYNIKDEAFGKERMLKGCNKVTVYCELGSNVQMLVRRYGIPIRRYPDDIEIELKT